MAIDYMRCPKCREWSMMCKPSDESGDRRQDAANDHGSEDCETLIRCAQVALSEGRYPRVSECLRQLQSAVSARSADDGVLEQVIAYVEEWAVQKRVHAEEMRHKYEQAAHREECEARLLGRLSKALLEKFQNQSSESGQGPAR